MIWLPWQRLDKWENKLLLRHRHVKRFHMVKRLRKSVQYVQRYLTKYVEPREHATQFPFVSLFSAETTEPILTKIYTLQCRQRCYLCMHTHHIIPFRFRVAQRQIRLVWEKRRFFDFDSLPWQRPLKNQKKLNELSKPIHLSTNPEILVKIALLVSQLRWLESRTLKKCMAEPS